MGIKRTYQFLTQNWRVGFDLVSLAVTWKRTNSSQITREDKTGENSSGQ